MQDVLLIILIPAALIVGGLVGFILAARKGREAQARADAAGRIEAELRGQIQQRDAELAATREKWPRSPNFGPWLAICQITHWATSYLARRSSWGQNRPSFSAR